MSSAILGLLAQGGVLKARQSLGFYVVQHGKTHVVDQDEAMRLVNEKKVRTEGVNKWGVMSFARTHLAEPRASQ